MDAYAKKDSSGPTALIDKLKNDLEKDVQAAEMELEREAEGEGGLRRRSVRGSTTRSATPRRAPAAPPPRRGASQRAAAARTRR